MKLNIKRTLDERATPEKIISDLLKDRDIVDVDAFLHPVHPKDIHFKSFFAEEKDYKKRFDKTIKLLKDIHKKQEMIVVYCDYDADGITGGAVLWETLHLLGFHVMPYTPDRKTEGYGFSKRGLDMVKKQFNPALIISVDHGIVAHKEIAYAESIGIPIVVTDHHQKINTPHEDAFAVFHTSALSGSGVAYFFAKELYDTFQLSSTNAQLIGKNFESDYAAISSIGTIADLVPLTGPSRALVKHGLISFSRTNRIGLYNLLKSTGIDGKALSPYEIGFVLAPRINAFGRLGSAMDALRLLCTKSAGRAAEYVSLANETNTRRQQLVEEALVEAEAMVDERHTLLIVKSEKWEEGIIGLIASRLSEKYHRPCIALTKSGSGYKASARSISGFDITRFLRSLSEYLESVGGHAAAAGFSISSKQLDAFEHEALERAVREIYDDALERVLAVDCDMPLALAALPLARELATLEPYGVGNPKPVFHSRGALVSAQLLGKKNNHLKLTVKHQDTPPLEVMLFGKSDLFPSLSRDQDISIVYNLEVNRWNGREKAQAIGKHIER